MERIEVIEHAAAALSARLSAKRAPHVETEHISRLCAVLSLELKATPTSDVMLGGAYSRLQLWDCARPEMGGFIWLRDDLDAATRIFAIAHELGHYVLHRGEGINLRPPCDEHQIDQQADPAGLRTQDHHVEEYTPRARRELEANAFAAELLVPRADVRQLFATTGAVDVAALVARFGISHQLAQRRLVDAVLAPPRPSSADHVDGVDTGASTLTSTAALFAPDELIGQLDASQQHAARAAGPALIVAGPGTGKTATLVGRVAHLVAERGIPPEKVLALTFSNRAAGEMRERLSRSGLPGERMPVMTIHACAAALLREYAAYVPHLPDEVALQPDFRILDEADAFLLLEELLARLPLYYYRSLGNPTAHLHTLLADFSRARDGLLTPADYLALVEAMPLMPYSPTAPGASLRTEHDQRERDEQHAHAAKTSAHHSSPHPPDGMYTAEQIARARERAAAYGVWDRELRQRGLLDFGALIQRAVELLRADAAVLANVRARFPAVLVDEFQDTNRAAAELLLLLAGPAATGLWVVGDRNQSIYRFRGASPGNVRRLAERHPNLRVLRLRRCYRSVPAIVRLGSAMVARMEALAATSTASAGPAFSDPLVGVDEDALREALHPVDLEPVRSIGTRPAILRGEAFVSAEHERAGLATAIARQRAAGYAYAEQAVLCRTHKQIRQIAAVLAAQGVPVTQLSDFFDRPEIKDALMLLALAAGPDARGVLRAAPLLVGLSYPPPAAGELAVAARALAARRQVLPWALRDASAFAQITGLSPSTRTGLAALGTVALRLRKSAAVGPALTEFLLRPGGYAWHLVRLADGLTTPACSITSAEAGAALLPEIERPAQAQQALAALGELVRLAWRFDTRWAREPDFRMRLSRAVTHQRGAPSAVPDALETVANADLLADAATNEPGPASATHDVSLTAPPVRCFLHYLSALRSAGVAVPVPAGTDDAVHLLTLHQSKGLEFPVVYLPGLAEGLFPAGTRTHEEVSPPGFRESESSEESAAEERCLFYVGVTRARDVVALTRATSYHTSATGAARPARPSSLLDLLAGSPDWSRASSLFDQDDLAQVFATAPAHTADPMDDEDIEPPAGSPLPLTEAAASKPVFQLRVLQQYLDCPRQYKYARSYGLLDPAEDAVYRFHRYIRRGRRTLGELREGAPGTQWPAAEARLKALWQTDGPAGHAYDAFYWQAAEAILHDEWQALTTPDEGAPVGRVLVARPLRAELHHCIVEVTADRVLEALPVPADRDPAAATETVLIRMHTGRPREDDKQDLALPLYYLAHQRQHPGTPLRILLGYTGQALARSTTTPDAPGPSEFVDVTEDARRTAERYLKPGRQQRSKLDKLDEAARAIAAARFAPRPDEHRCAACAYCYVCPADPDDAGERVESARATTTVAPTTSA